MNLKNRITKGRSEFGNGSFDIADFTTQLLNTAGSSQDMMGMATTAMESISLEGLAQPNDVHLGEIKEVYGDLSEKLGEAFENYNADRGPDAARVSENQRVAGTLAAMVSAEKYSGSYMRMARDAGKRVESSDPNFISVNPQLSGPFGGINTMDPATALENYNEKPQRDFRVISVAYNLSASRQDAFGEAIYPTTVVDPSEGGAVQLLTYAAVMADAYHQATGAVFDNSEVNMVESFRDPSVLENEATKIVPIVEDDASNAAAFVADTDVGDSALDLGPLGTVNTRPLKMGARFDLMGISNRDALQGEGLLDITDTIDPAMRLKAVYVKIGGSADKVIKFTTERMPSAVFTPALTGDTRNARLLFETDDLVIDGDTTAVDGSTNTQMDTIGTNEWTIRMHASVSGSVSLSKGTTQLQAPDGEYVSITDVDGNSISTTSGTGATLLTAIGTPTIVGYDLEARFTNTNRRQRGQLVQVRKLQFRYPIPMHSPITLPMSTMDENGPGDVVKTLTVATNIRASNNAVSRLLNYAKTLAEMTGSGLSKPKFGAIEGALTAMIRPTYSYASLDLRDTIDTLRSQDRFEDVTAAILNKIRSLLYPAYRSSNIEAVYQTITGNADEKPIFILATDKEIAHYLMMRGDDRTLGAELEYKIVSTNNQNFDGKIMVIPTRKNAAENDILSFGQFYYVPTLVADLPISRTGQTSREIAAIPINLHVNNIPFMIELDVLGLGEVMGTSRYNSLPGFQHEQVEIDLTP